MEIKCGNVGKWLVPTCVRIPLCTHRLVAPGEQSSFFVWLLSPEEPLRRYSAGSTWLLIWFALLLILVKRKRLEFWLEPPGVPQVSPSSCAPASRGPWCLEAPWSLFLSLGHTGSQSYLPAASMHPALCMLRFLSCRVLPLLSCCISALLPFVWMPSTLPFKEELGEEDCLLCWL